MIPLRLLHCEKIDIFSYPLGKPSCKNRLFRKYISLLFRILFQIHKELTARIGIVTNVFIFTPTQHNAGHLAILRLVYHLAHYYPIYFLTHFSSQLICQRMPIAYLKGGPCQLTYSGAYVHQTDRGRNHTPCGNLVPLQ